MREEKKWLRHGEMVSSIFLLAVNLISNPVVKVRPKRSHSDQTQNTLLGIRKYP